MDSEDRNLGRLQDIEDKPQVERLDDNRAVIRTGNVKEDSVENSTETDVNGDSNSVSKKFTMKVQVKRNGKVKQSKLKADSMRGLIQKFTFWASSVSKEDLTDILNKV